MTLPIYCYAICSYCDCFFYNSNSVSLIRVKVIICFRIFSTVKRHNVRKHISFILSVKKENTCCFTIKT